MHAASDIYTEENNIIRQKWYYSNTYVFQEEKNRKLFSNITKCYVIKEY